MSRRPWETPCANRRYTAHFGILVDPWRLDECGECEYCGSCATHMCHRDDATALRHLDWFKDFANPGEPECGSAGRPKHLTNYEPRPCNLPAGHGGERHRARMGWSWPVVRERL
ncbi:hypothetical protein ACWD25_52760 [Streptomyces sp. NPDC002920]